MANRYHYHRPYCENCNLIYSRLSTGLVLNCQQCGKPLVFKSFNPRLKLIGGLIILLVSAFTLLIAAFPIIWIGGFIWGISMVYYGYKQWLEVKKLDEEIEGKVEKDMKSIERKEKKESKISKTNHCSYCGIKVRKDTKFCVKCGKEIK